MLVSSFCLFAHPCSCSQPKTNALPVLALTGLPGTPKNLKKKPLVFPVFPVFLVFLVSGRLFGKGEATFNSLPKTRKTKKKQKKKKNHVFFVFPQKP